VAAFLTFALVWGLTFSAVETGLSTVPPVLFMAFRYDLGAFLLLGYVISRGDHWRPRTRGDLLAVVAGGVLWTAIGNGIWYVGQDLTTSVFSGMMANLIPVMTASFSWVVLPEDRLTPLSLVGLLVGFVGALVMMLPNDGVAFTAGLFGKAIVFSGVCGATLGSVLIRRAKASVSSTGQTAWSVSLGTVLLHALSPLLGKLGPER
jgi:drug/metabolite transporter (DMT)-like permease